MIFTHDTVDALLFTARLVNTGAARSLAGEEELPDPDALAQLLNEWQYSGRRDLSTDELVEVRRTRTLLENVWLRDRDSTVRAVNHILSEAGACPQLVRHDGFDWHVHATGPGAPLAERIRVETAMALVDVIRTDATDRLRECEADACRAVFVDLSKNGSKRFCRVQCGNRMAQRALRARTKPS